MNDDKILIEALRRLSVQTGSLVCLGCGYEHNCDIHGCAIVRAAREQLEKLTASPWISVNDRLPKDDVRVDDGDKVLVIVSEATREHAIRALKAKGYEVVNTLFTDEWYSDAQMKQRGVENIPLCFLAKSLENMSLCHAAFFCEGWENARGCKIEHEAAVAYGLDIIYENEEA